MNESQPAITGIILLTSLIGLLPFAVITMTSFIKISVVLFLLRNALGIQQTPPNIILYGISIVLTLFISAPVASQVYERVGGPNVKFDTFQDWLAAGQKAEEPVRQFLTRFTTEPDRDFFLSATQRLWPEDARQGATSSDLVILIPSFVIAELKRAFEIGFLIYLPFISIDLVISAILMSLGMAQVPPITISVPFKLFLFVALNGWTKLIHGLILSYI